jgi:formate C-acetyltransferase
MQAVADGGPPAPLELMEELGEFAAAGFYRARAAGEPWPIPYGRAVRELYERMEIRIPDGRILVPAEPMPHARRRRPGDTIGDMGKLGVGLLLGPESIFGLKVSDHMIEPLKQRRPGATGAIDALAADLKKHFMAGALKMTHSSPDIQRVLDVGLLAMRAELEGEIEKLALDGNDPRGLSLLRAVREAVAGIEALHRRIGRKLASEATRRPDLAPIAAAWAQVALRPAKSFLEGILGVNFIWMIDGCDSIGRLDQQLGGLLEADLRDGQVSLDLVRRLLDDLWAYHEAYGGWNLQIGGRMADGGVCDNLFTREVLLACRRNGTSKPSVSLRVARDTPEETLIDAARTIGTGCGQPAMYNDERYIELLESMAPPVSTADAVEVGYAGCTETLINGMTNCGTVAGRHGMDLPRPVLWAIFDGRSDPGGDRDGAETGDFAAMESFEQFLDAVKRQLTCQVMQYIDAYETHFEQYRHTGDPHCVRTFLTRDCVVNHESFAFGGARYNWHYVNCLGTTTLIDAVCAVRHCVYETHAVDASRLRDALARDFQDCQDLRATLAEAPKFGNDDPNVDRLGRELLEHVWGQFASRRGPLGGQYVPSTIPWGLYVSVGARLPATPDGRRAGQPLNDSIGPAAGRDRKGPTAMLNSVSALPLEMALGTPVLNVRLQREFINDQGGPDRVAAMVRAFFARGGMHMQVSVLDPAQLRAAQKDPASHRGLLVRIGGYSEYFTALDPTFQESIIQRMEHAL